MLWHRRDLIPDQLIICGFSFTTFEIILLTLTNNFTIFKNFSLLTYNLHPMWVYLVQKTPRFKIPYPYAKLLTSKICYILDPSVSLVSNNFSFGDLII